MFKFSAVSQIWKKYIQKLNAWDLSLTDYYINGITVSLESEWYEECLSDILLLSIEK